MADRFRLSDVAKKLELFFNNVFVRQDGSSNMQVQQSTTDVSDPPTDAELDAIFGTPATLGRGFIGTIDDNSGEADVYLVVTTDNKWWRTTLTWTS